MAFELYISPALVTSPVTVFTIYCAQRELASFSSGQMNEGVRSVTRSPGRPEAVNVQYYDGTSKIYSTPDGLRLLEEPADPIIKVIVPEPYRAIGKEGLARAIVHYKSGTQRELTISRPELSELTEGLNRYFITGSDGRYQDLYAKRLSS